MFHVKQLFMLLVVYLLVGCATSQHVPISEARSDLPLRQSDVTVSGSDVQLTGVLYQPTIPGPYPAMLLLHGCAGFRNARGIPNESHRFWAEHWVRNGFVVLLLDSFTPRGEKEICTQTNRKIRVDVERTKDAYAGLEFLANLPEVRRNRIFVQGWSNGGSTVLSAVSTIAVGRTSGGPQFRAAVAYYPGCLQPLRRMWNPTVPLLIQAGAADDWTPASYCDQLTARAKAAGAQIEIDIYLDAHHSFDRLAQPVRFLPNVAAGKGAHVGTHPVAREQSLRRTTDWVLTHLP